MSDNPGDTSRTTGGTRAGERTRSNGDGARIAGDRLVRWIPRKLGALAAEVSTPSDLCIVSDVIEELRRQTRARPERRVAGLLVGRRGRHARSERPFTLVERCLACEAAPRGDQSAFHEDLLALREEVEGDDGAEEVVGWYHSHSLLGVFLSEQDTRFHEEHFPESWQCALILVSDRERPAGGVFQQTEGLGLRRSIYVPFYEVVGEGSVLPDGRRRCRLDWENYVTETPVARGSAGDAEEAGAAAAAGTADGAGGAGGGRAAVDGAPAGRAPRRPPDRTGAGGPGGRRTGDLSADIPVVIPMEDRVGLLASHRRAVVAAGLVLALALGGWWAWGQLTDGGSAAAPAPPAEPVARAVEDADAGARVATDAGADAAATSGETAAAPAGPGGPADAPAASGTDAAGAAAGARSTPATPAPDTRGAAGGADVGGAPEGAVSAFEQAFRVFDSSVGAYGQRRQAFAAGNLECATLADAYRRVDEAFITLSARYARPGVPGAVGGRYEDAANRMEAVDRHFDASGCPRPQ